MDQLIQGENFSLEIVFENGLHYGRDFVSWYMFAGNFVIELVILVIICL